MRLAPFFLIGLAVLAACTAAPTQTTPEQEPDAPETSVGTWQTTPLTDVRTNESFTVAQFDKPVLVESFAVWCPTCTKQQKVTKQLHETDDSFVSISLNTDPNEDREKVLEHAQRHGFEWRYAIAPGETTQSLISEFGPAVINAPTVPMVLVCPDGRAELLGEHGVKTAAELTAAVQRC